MAGKVVHLLAIDCQNDFCNPAGALFVQGADEDMKRLSAFVRRTKGKLDDIHVTLDCHQELHISHPIFWVDSNKNHPNPFTIITHKDVEDGIWNPYLPGLRDQALNYTKSLEKNGRYVLCVWPPHCLIGTSGNALVPEFSDAINKWARDNFALVSFVTKGSNWKTEHYSAVQADVPDPDDDTTGLNEDLINAMSKADVIAIAGEALDFCVANTIRDIASKFGDENVKKFVLLRDACSSVNAPGLEHLGQEFVDEMCAKGMQISSTVDFMS